MNTLDFDIAFDEKLNKAKQQLCMNVFHSLFTDITENARVMYVLSNGAINDDSLIDKTFAQKLIFNIAESFLPYIFQRRAIIKDIDTQPNSYIHVIKDSEFFIQELTINFLYIRYILDIAEDTVMQIIFNLDYRNIDKHKAARINDFIFNQTYKDIIDKIYNNRMAFNKDYYTQDENKIIYDVDSFTAHINNDHAFLIAEVSKDIFGIKVKEFDKLNIGQKSLIFSFASCLQKHFYSNKNIFSGVYNYLSSWERMMLSLNKPLLRLMLMNLGTEYSKETNYKSNFKFDLNFLTCICTEDLAHIEIAINGKYTEFSRTNIYPQFYNLDPISLLKITNGKTVREIIHNQHKETDWNNPEGITKVGNLFCGVIIYPKYNKYKEIGLKDSTCLTSDIVVEYIITIDPLGVDKEYEKFLTKELKNSINELDSEYSQDVPVLYFNNKSTLRIGSTLIYDKKIRLRNDKTFIDAVAAMDYKSKTLSIAISDFKDITKNETPLDVIMSKMINSSYDCAMFDYFRGRPYIYKPIESRIQGNRSSKEPKVNQSMLSSAYNKSINISDKELHVKLFPKGALAYYNSLHDELDSNKIPAIIYSDYLNTLKSELQSVCNFLIINNNKLDFYNRESILNFELKEIIERDDNKDNKFTIHMNVSFKEDIVNFNQRCIFGDGKNILFKTGSQVSKSSTSHPINKYQKESVFGTPCSFSTLSENQIISRFLIDTKSFNSQISTHVSSRGDSFFMSMYVLDKYGFNFWTKSIVESKQIKIMFSNIMSYLTNCISIQKNVNRLPNGIDETRSYNDSSHQYENEFMIGMKKNYFGCFGYDNIPYEDVSEVLTNHKTIKKLKDFFYIINESEFRNKGNTLISINKILSTDLTVNTEELLTGWQGVDDGTNQKTGAYSSLDKIQKRKLLNAFITFIRTGSISDINKLTGKNFTHAYMYMFTLSRVMYKKSSDIVYFDFLFSILNKDTDDVTMSIINEKCKEIYNVSAFSNGDNKVLFELVSDVTSGGTGYANQIGVNNVIDADELIKTLSIAILRDKKIDIFIEGARNVTMLDDYIRNTLRCGETLNLKFDGQLKLKELHDLSTDTFELYSAKTMRAHRYSYLIKTIVESIRCYLHYDYEIIVSNQRLSDEGKNQSHCVYNRKSYIESGDALIISFIDNFNQRVTTQVNNNLTVKESRYKRNANVPDKTIKNLKDDLGVILTFVSSIYKRLIDEGFGSSSDIIKYFGDIFSNNKGSEIMRMIETDLSTGHTHYFTDPQGVKLYHNYVDTISSDIVMRYINTVDKVDEKYNVSVIKDSDLPSAEEVYKELYGNTLYNIVSKSYVRNKMAAHIKSKIEYHFKKIMIDFLFKGIKVKGKNKKDKPTVRTNFDLIYHAGKKDDVTLETMKLMSDYNMLQNALGKDTKSSSVALDSLIAVSGVKNFIKDTSNKIQSTTKRISVDEEDDLPF